jgi:hypothetical protein
MSQLAVYHDKHSVVCKGRFPANPQTDMSLRGSVWMIPLLELGEAYLVVVDTS